MADSGECTARSSAQKAEESWRGGGEKENGIWKIENGEGEGWRSRKSWDPNVTIKSSTGMITLSIDNHMVFIRTVEALKPVVGQIFRKPPVRPRLPQLRSFLPEFFLPFSDFFEPVYFLNEVIRSEFHGCESVAVQMSV